MTFLEKNVSYCCSRPTGTMVKRNTFRTARNQRNISLTTDDNCMCDDAHLAHTFFIILSHLMYCDIFCQASYRQWQKSSLLKFVVRTILDNIRIYIQETKVCLTLTVNLKCAILRLQKNVSFNSLCILCLFQLQSSNNGSVLSYNYGFAWRLFSMMFLWFVLWSKNYQKKHIEVGIEFYFLCDTLSQYEIHTDIFSPNQK